MVFAMFIVDLVTVSEFGKSVAFIDQQTFCDKYFAIIQFKKFTKKQLDTIIQAFE